MKEVSDYIHFHLEYLQKIEQLKLRWRHLTQFEDDGYNENRKVSVKQLLSSFKI